MLYVAGEALIPLVGFHDFHVCWIVFPHGRETGNLRQDRYLVDKHSPGTADSRPKPIERLLDSGSPC
jgi:hypothetical protein